MRWGSIVAASGAAVALWLGGAVSSAAAHDPLALIAVQPGEQAAILDLTTNTVTSTVTVGQDVGSFAFSPDGRAAYVAFGGGIGSIDLEADTVPNEQFGSEGWSQYIAVTPDGSQAFVDLGQSEHISSVELGGRREDHWIETGEQGASELRITPDGRTVVVLNTKLNAVIPVDVATHVVGAPIPFTSVEENDPRDAIAMSPDGKTVYEVGRPFDAIASVDLATSSAGAPIQLHAGELNSIAISPDGRTAYVTAPEEEAVLVVSLASGAVEAAIPAGKRPGSIALTPDGRTALVANYESGTATPIDLTTRTPAPAIAVGGYPKSIAIDAPAAPALAPASVPPVAAPPGSPPPRSAARCQVPRLRRLGLRAMRSRLHRDHCRLGRVRYRRSRHRRGALLAQSERPGRRLPADAAISVVLSRGPRR